MKNIYFACLIVLVFSTSVSSNNWEHLCQRAKYQDAKISPDGKHIAIAMDSEGKRVLVFLNRKSMEMVGTAKLPDINEVGNFHWVNNERVVIKINQRNP